MNKEELIDFEKKVADTFNAAKIRAPIHLHGGNEEKLIEIFQKIKKELVKNYGLQILPENQLK